MPGLQLGVSASGISAARPPSMSQADTITQMAYGVGSGADAGSGGPKVAGFGALGSATLGAITLAWLWYTLPR